MKDANDKTVISKRLANVEESATLRMAVATREAKASGNRVVNLSVGEPHWKVPESVKKAAIDAVKDDFSIYTPVPGIAELRERIAKKFRDENGLSYGAGDVIVTTGAKQALYNFLMAVVYEGDQVIIPSPYWTSYPEMVKLAGGEPVIIMTDEKNDFKITAKDLVKHLSTRTRVLMLNSPGNPTGSVYSKEELAEIAKALEGTKVLVCSDEIYEKLIFDGKKVVSFGALSPDAFLRTITVNGFSKTYAMTGWRLGYAAGPKKIIDAMILIQGQSTSGPNSVAQKAGVVALDYSAKEFAPTLKDLHDRRDQMVGLMKECKDVSFNVPDGAFYLFLNVGKLLGKKDSSGKTVGTSEDLALYLLREVAVGTVPGSGFGREGYLRVSFAATESDVAEGTKRMIKAFGDLK